MKGNVIFFALIFLFGSSPMLTAQQSAKKLKASAESYFKRDKYHEAYNLFSKYARLKTPDANTMLKIGLSAYHANRLEESVRYLESIVANEKKVDKHVYYVLGRAYHQQRNYKKAIQTYKAYLAKTKFDDDKRENVKDNILRCASGLNLTYVDERAVVENMGNKVNAAGDDFGPVLSPNHDNKLYFSSAREGATGGLRNTEGYIDNRYGNYSTDIFSTIIINGEWTSTTPLPSLINSVRNEVLLDFNDNGMVLYYYKGLKKNGGELLVDSFSVDQNKLNPPSLKTPVNAQKGDSGLYFFNDSLLLFSSHRPEGAGGKDIYVTTKEDGYWTVPRNLGLNINTPYDEISPFLSKDGRTLYFSSNNPKSIGGMDIYRARYNDGKQSWEEPENMAYPINSPSDDKNFRLGPSGLEAYFASDRKTGLGGLDLYTAYFKSKLYEQTVASNPVVFTQVPAYRQKQQMTGVVFEAPDGQPATSYPSTVNFPEATITTVEVNPLHYRNDDDLLSQTNSEKLNEVIRLMKEYPQVKLMLTAHSDASDPIEFDLFFSIKRAEKIAKYLTDNGINAANIYLKGVGANYPAAMQETEQGPSMAAKKLNRRIDLEIFNTAGLPLRVNNNGPIVSKFMKDDRGTRYNQAVKGLSYKVQIAALAQRYKGNTLIDYQNSLIEATFNNKNYQYSVGLFQTFSAAERMRKELEISGLTDVFIVPYINGVRASKGDSKIYAAAYPDLLNFLSQTNQE